MRALLLIALCLGGCSPAGLQGFASFAQGYERGQAGIPEPAAIPEPIHLGPTLSCHTFQLGFETHTECN